VLKHNDALAMWRGVSAGRGGRHQDEAGAHHLLLLLHHGRARSRVGALQTVIVMEVGPINPAEPSPRLADASSLHQAARGHHARGGRHLPRSSASSALSQPVRLDLHLLKGSSTEAMSDVFKAQFVALYACHLRALQEVLRKAVVGQDVARGGGQDVAGGGGGRADHWGGHAAQAEAQCPRNSQQQHHLIQLSEPVGR